MPKVVVLHSSYGCDTGCCGHYCEVDGKEVGWDFGHPYSAKEEDRIAYAKKLIEHVFGRNHTLDLDWENSRVLDD